MIPHVFPRRTLMFVVKPRVMDFRRFSKTTWRTRRSTLHISTITLIGIIAERDVTTKTEGNDPRHAISQHAFLPYVQWLPQWNIWSGYNERDAFQTSSLCTFVHVCRRRRFNGFRSQILMCHVLRALVTLKTRLNHSLSSSFWIVLFFVNGYNAQYH